jgi:carboxyl-terminal processing protease
MVVVGLIGGLLPAGLWARQQLVAIRGHRETARRWRWILLGSQAAIFLGISLLVVIQLYQIGTLPPLNQDRVANFDRLWRAMAKHYPYFEEKAIDWDAMYARYRPQIEEATSDAAYFTLIETMLAELNDAHTDLRPSLVMNQGCFFAATREMDGQAVVVQVGPTGYNAGLEIGTVILEVDGRPVEEALAHVDLRLRKGSTSRQQRRRAFQFLVHTPLGSERDLAFETPDGTLRMATLACTEEVVEADSGGGGDVWDFLLPVMRPEIVSQQLPSGLGYIRVPTLGANLVAEFDAALNELMDTPGIILDLRGNGGGNSAYGDQIAGRFLSEPFVYGRDYYAGRLPTRAWRAWMPFEVTPRAPVYSGPVVVIMETVNMSSAEQFLIALVDSGRVETVGRPTGGASGNPVVFRLPGAHNVRFSTADFHRNDGTPIEGVGLTPDVEVTWTVEDLRQGRDPDLEAAEQLLLEILERP